MSQYTKLLNIPGMASGEPAYSITRCIFARFAVFLEPVIVLEINKFPDKIYLFDGHTFPVKYAQFLLDLSVGQ